ILGQVYRWWRHRDGLVTSCAAESGAYYRSSDDVDVPDLEVELLVGIGDDHGRRIHPGHGFTAHLLLSRPESTGEVRLADPDTRVDPLIDPNYFDAPADMVTLIRGTQRVIDIMEDPALDRYRGGMLYPYDRDDPEQ